MAVFSTDQNRQLYVVKDLIDDVDSIANLGEAAVVTDKDGFYHLVQKGYGGLVKSDVIDPAKVLCASVTAPDKMAKKLKKATITLNGGNVIAGQDYILRINFRQLYGMSDEDIYQKYACVAGTSVMNETEFYLTLAQSILKNFKRCVTPLIGVALEGTSTTTVINDIKKVNGTWKVNGGAAPSTINGVTLLELPLTSEYVRGTAKLETVNFEAIPTTITKVTEGVKEEVIWGTVTKATQDGKDIPNTYDLADLEYFCMGERGDQYREKMWPNNINTQYMIDLTNSTGYYVIDITYAYSGDCEDVQKSKKTLTIVTDTEAKAKDIAKAFAEITYVESGITLKSDSQQ